MAGNAPPNQTPPQAGALPIIVNAQYIKDLSFENPNAPQMLAPGNAQPNLDVHIDLQTRTGPDDSYEVTLHVKAEAKAGDAVAFVAEIAYAGLFTLKGLPKEAIQPVLMIEAPRLLFPFVRNILADVTRDGGFAPLMLQPIDFADMYRRHLAAQHDGQGVPVGNA